MPNYLPLYNNTTFLLSIMPQTAPTTTGKPAVKSKRGQDRQARKETNLNSSIASHKIRLYPTEAQAERLRLACDLRRDAANWVCAEMRHIIDHYSQTRDDMLTLAHHSLAGQQKMQACHDSMEASTWLTETDLSSQFTEIMKTDPWYGRYKNHVPLHVARPGIRDKRKAYDSWAKRRKQGLPGGFPVFQSQHDPRQGCEIARSATEAARCEIDMRRKANGGYHKHALLTLPVISRGQKGVPGVGKIKMAERPRFKGQIRQIHIILEAGEWYAVFVINKGDRPAVARQPHEGITSAVEVGSRTLATCYDPASGSFQTYENRKAAANQAQNLKRAQRKIASKQGSRKGEKKSRRFKRLREIIAANHQTTANQRKDNTHKTTTAIVSSADHIICETLNIQSMTSRGGKRKKAINRTTLDANLGELLRQLDYKTDWAGKSIAPADQWYASSQICPACDWQSSQTASATYRCQHPDCGFSANGEQVAAFNLFWQREPAGHVKELNQPELRGRGTTPRRSSDGVKKKPARPLQATRIDTSHLGCVGDEVRERARQAFLACRDWTDDDAGNKKVSNVLASGNYDRSRDGPVSEALVGVSGAGGLGPLEGAAERSV